MKELFQKQNWDTEVPTLMVGVFSWVQVDPECHFQVALKIIMTRYSGEIIANLSYLEGRGRKIASSKEAQAKLETLSQNQI
jgi:hypothetical protein